MLNFAVSVLLSKTDVANGLFTASHFLHTGPYADEDAAIGAATMMALKGKPDFAVADVVASEITFSDKK